MALLGRNLYHKPRFPNLRNTNECAYLSQDRQGPRIQFDNTKPRPSHATALFTSYKLRIMKNKLIATEGAFQHCVTACLQHTCLHVDASQLQNVLFNFSSYHRILQIHLGKSFYKSIPVLDVRFLLLCHYSPTAHLVSNGIPHFLNSSPANILLISSIMSY